MQNTKTFILKAAISSLLVLSTMSPGGYAES
uniref:IncF plasmid conjugative transfer pilus assembly protein TraF n=1 Tax=Klebsiella pneumoniae TaxID=573 RepID=A0A8B0SU46_KLEPN|nr:IncF plasmid conjugative transfer pilus assembly protein TraF [Klebsiella pneumoniae]